MIDFRSPQLIAKFDGKDVNEVFGGFKPRGWLKSAEVSVELGGIGEFSLVIEPPFDDAVKFIDDMDFMAGQHTIEIKFGYLGNPPIWTPNFRGTILDFPELSFGAESTTITLKGSGLSYVAKKSKSFDDYKNKSLIEVIASVLYKYGYEISEWDRVPAIDEISIYVDEYSKRGNKVVFVVNGNVKLSDIPYESLQQTEDDWTFVMNTLNENSYVMTDMGDAMMIFEIGSLSIQKQSMSLVLFGNMNPEKNIYALESFDIQPTATFWSKAFSEVTVNAVDENGKLLKSVKQEDKSDDITAQKVESGNVKAMDLGVHVSAENSTGISVPQRVEDKVNRAESIKNYTNVINRTFGAVSGSGSIIGLPFLMPGVTAYIDLRAKVMSGTWICKKVTHTYSDGYSSSGEFMLAYADNVNKKAPKDDQKTEKAAKIGVN